MTLNSFRYQTLKVSQLKVKFYILRLVLRLQLSFDFDYTLAPQKFCKGAKANAQKENLQSPLYSSIHSYLVCTKSAFETNKPLLQLTLNNVCKKCALDKRSTLFAAL